MAAIPAKCQRCSFIFPSAVEATGVRGLRLHGLEQTCPKCSGTAQMIDGTFDIGAGPSGPFRQIGGRPVDPSLFAHIGLILIEAKEKSDRPDMVIERVERHAPGIAQRLRAVMDDPVAFATVLAATIAGFAGVAAAVISSGGAQPSPSSIQINVHTDGGFDRERESLNRLRQYKGTMPSWASDYLEPNKT